MDAEAQAHKRTSSTAGNENTTQPPVKQARSAEAERLYRQQQQQRQLATSKPNRVYVVEHVKKPRPTGDWRDEGQPEPESRTSLGVFVSLANANREVRREMEYWESEWGDLGENSIFDEGSDNFDGTPPTEGQKVGSVWEYDDEEESVHHVGVVAYPLVWPEDYYMSDEDDEEDDDFGDRGGDEDAEGEEE